MAARERFDFRRVSLRVISIAAGKQTARFRALRRLGSGLFAEYGSQRPDVRMIRRMIRIAAVCQVPYGRIGCCSEERTMAMRWAHGSKISRTQQHDPTEAGIASRRRSAGRWRLRLERPKRGGRSDSCRGHSSDWLAERLRCLLQQPYFTETFIEKTQKKVGRKIYLMDKKAAPVLKKQAGAAFSALLRRGRHRYRRFFEKELYLNHFIRSSSGLNCFSPAGAVILPNGICATSFQLSGMSHSGLTFSSISGL